MSSNERFVRWQAILREHLSYSIGLVLTFSVAAFGYCFGLVRDQAFTPAAGLFRGMFWLSLFLLWTSLVLGGICILNRLGDFRGTAKRARGTDGDVPDKAYLDELGKLTWKLFTLQIIAFASGVTILGIVVLRTSGERLFWN